MWTEECELAESSREIEQRCPIARLLPYGGPFDNERFAIYPPSVPEFTILIEIDEAADEQEAKEAALDWIRAQGYDPENLGCEIVFRVRPFPVWPTETPTPTAAVVAPVTPQLEPPTLTETPTPSPTGSTPPYVPPAPTATPIR